MNLFTSIVIASPDAIRVKQSGTLCTDALDCFAAPLLAMTKGA